MRAVVVGAGAAGTAAALALALGGAEVTVVDGAAGATVGCSGAWDVASVPGDHPLAKASLAQRILAMAETRPKHPYSRMSDPLDTVARVHDLVLPALGGYRAIDLSSRGVRVATDRGVIRRAASIEASILDLDRAPGQLVAVADLRGHPRCDGGFLARSLSSDSDAGDLVFVDVPLEYLSRRSDALMLPHEAAALGDAADARRRLAFLLTRALPQAGPYAWLVPPLLGLDVDGVRSLFEKSLGHPVGEVAQAGPGPQGARLTRRLAAARAAADVTDVSARAVRLDPGRVTLSDNVVCSADAVVLATGSALAGGLAPTENGLAEPLTGTPVSLGAFGSFSAPGAGFASGVRWDDGFRLIGDDDAPLMDSLFVCGSLLEGVSHADGTGLGAAITTGWRAGESALAG